MIGGYLCDDGFLALSVVQQGCSGGSTVLLGWWILVDGSYVATADGELTKGISECFLLALLWQCWLFLDCLCFSEA